MVLTENNKLQIRFLLFLLGCIPTRLVLTYLSYSTQNSTVLPLFTFLIGVSFLYLYMTNGRQTGSEVFNEKIWWTKYRVVHGSLYILFSILAFNRYPHAWMILLIDTLFGLSLFLNHHLSN